MSHGGSSTSGQPSCTTISFGKYVRRTFRAAVGMKKKPKRKKPKDVPMMERVSSFSPESAATVRKESVVRVVLKSGVVEAYPGVVLACTVIQKHPPGLCLAHPDVFRNPHGAVVRPLEPLFPGQKFLLLPETTVIRLKQKIPESSIGAFAHDDDEDGEEASEEDQDQDYSSGTTASSSEEERDAAVGDDGFMAGCSAREFYVANDRWSECRFKTPDHQPERNNAKAKKKKRKGKTKKRKDRRVAAPAGFRMLTVPRRIWEPSLPSVVEGEEEACSSPHSTPASPIRVQTRAGDHMNGK